MKAITYIFNDGTVSTVEVSDELYAEHEKMVLAEKHNHKRETRRHISLDYLNENGIDFEAADGNPLDCIINQENEREFENKLSCLKLRQRELLQMFLLDGKTITQIAVELGLAHSTISERLATIFKKLKNLF